MSDGPLIGASPEGIVHNIRAAVRQGSGMTLWGVDYMPLSAFDRLALIGLIEIAVTIAAPSEDEVVQMTNLRVGGLAMRLRDFHQSCAEMRAKLGEPPDDPEKFED